MTIWKKTATPEQLNKFSDNTIISCLNIQITEVGNDFIVATMPVDETTRQPMGFLHGGASVVLAETLGSIAGHLAVEDNKIVFGVEINANHLKSVKSGVVTGRVQPLRLGRTMQVWDITIKNESGELVCVSRLTTAIK